MSSVNKLDFDGHCRQRQETEDDIQSRNGKRGCMFLSFLILITMSSCLGIYFTDTGREK